MLAKTEDDPTATFPGRETVAVMNPCSVSSMKIWRNDIRRQLEFIKFKPNIAQLNIKVVDEDDRRVGLGMVYGQGELMSQDALCELLQKEM